MNHRLMRRVALFVMLVGLTSASMAGESVSLQAGTDRMGADYKAITMTSADPQICRQACADDGVCKSYSYVKPGVKGPDAMCFLKSSVVAATANECCSSGVKTIAMVSMPVKPSKAATINPALKVGVISPTAADPVELLKQVNALKAQLAGQEDTIAELKSLLALARDDIQAIKTSNKNVHIGLSESVDKLNTNLIALKNQFINFKTDEYEKHYHNLKGIVGNGVESGTVMLKTAPGTLGDTVKKFKKTSGPLVVE